MIDPFMAASGQRRDTFQKLARIDATSKRVQVLALHEQGKTVADIARALSLLDDEVRRIIGPAARG